MARIGVAGVYLDELIQRQTMPFDLLYLEIGPSTGGVVDNPLRISNAGRYVTINSATVGIDANLNGTYIPQGDLLAVGDIDEDADFQIGEMSISLSGVTGAAISLLLGNPYLHKKVKIWRGLFDDNFAVLQDPVIIFDGDISAAAIEDDPESGVSTVSVTVSSQWVDFERRNGTKTNDAEQQFRFPGDKGFEFAAQTIRNIKWGRES